MLYCRIRLVIKQLIKEFIIFTSHINKSVKVAIYTRIKIMKSFDAISI